LVSLSRVELGHQLTIGCSGRGEFFAAVFELKAQLEQLLLAVGECLLKAVNVVGCSETAVTEDSLAEAFRKPAF
jgi:hypothetical protein